MLGMELKLVRLTMDERADFLGKDQSQAFVTSQAPEKYLFSRTYETLHSFPKYEFSHEMNLS